MITLDEAIEYERKQAEMYRCEYECECDYYCKGFVDDDAAEFECIKKMYEHEQRAKWLEELKMYKEVGTVEGYKSAIECYNEEYTMRKSNKQYNNAIDDFVKFANTMPSVEEEDGTIRPMWLEEIAEKLKERDVK